MDAFAPGGWIRVGVRLVRAVVTGHNLAVQGGAQPAGPIMQPDSNAREENGIGAQMGFSPVNPFSGE